MTHLTRDVLVEWRDRPTEEARAIVVAHLAVCPECAGRYAELVRTRPADEAPARFDPAAFTERAHADAPRAPAKAAATPAPAPTRRWSVVTVAAAAIIVLAVFVAQLDRSERPEGPTTRGAGDTLVAVAPSGIVSRADVFRWESPSGVVRLEVLDAADQVVLEVRVPDQTSYTLAPADRDRLQPGVEYRWTVSRLDARGETIESSRPTTFQIAR